MKKIIFFTVLLAASIAYGATVDRGTRVITGDLHVGGNIFNRSFHRIATIIIDGADYVLSETEALCRVLIVTGSPDGYSVIAPTISESGVSRLFTVMNSGGDSGSINIKVSGGTGVDVATGSVANVFFNGTDYVRETADVEY